MLGAAYFRELYYLRMQGKDVDLNDRQYVGNIGKDLLNPVFSSLTTRDIISPIRTFTLDGHEYIRDRGYSFEQKLNRNTKGILDKRLRDYTQPEEKAPYSEYAFQCRLNEGWKKTCYKHTQCPLYDAAFA